MKSIDKPIKYIKSPIGLRLLTVILIFAAGIAINRSLGLEMKGIYTTITYYANFIQLFLNCGICYIYPILRKEREDDAKTTISTLIWIQVLIMALLSMVASLFYIDNKTLYIIWLSTVLICNNQVVFVSMIDNIQKRNSVLLFTSITYLVLNIVIFLFFKGRVELHVGALIIKYVLEIIICCKNESVYQFKIGSIDRSVLMKIVNVGFPSAFLAVLILCNYNIDVFMLNWMNSGNMQVGIYGVASTLSNILWVVPDAFKELVYNKSAQNTDNSSFVLKCIKTNTVFCLAICLGFLLFGKYFLGLVYGREYRAAFLTTMTLFLGIIPMIAFKLIHPVYINEGKAKTVILPLVIAVLTNIISSYYLIPLFGSFGAAISSVISYALCGTMFFLKYWRDYC